MNNILAKLIKIIKAYQYHAFLAVCITLISFISFNLGRISALQKTPLKITGEQANLYQSGSNLKSPLSPGFGRAGEIQNPKQIQNIKSQTQKLDTRVVASKASSSKKYHFTWCAGAQKIKETNKIWFENESVAQKAGYTLAGNCQ